MSRNYYGYGMCGRRVSKRRERVVDACVVVFGIVVLAVFAYAVWVMPWE